MTTRSEGSSEGSHRAAISPSRDDSWRLAMHLISAHSDPMAICRPAGENADQHGHEHNGPGTIRNHDPAWLGYDDSKIERVLAEAEALDGG